MANDCIPFFEPGQHPTGKATAAITGKRFLQVSGNRTGGPLLGTNTENLYQVAQAGAAGTAGANREVIGVAAYDVPNGGTVKIIRGGIVPVTAAASLSAGARVSTDATGQVIAYTATAGNVQVGILMADVTSGNDAEVALTGF